MEFLPHYQDALVTLYQGHVLDVLSSLPDESVQTIITSPPYWALRDYKIPAQVWGGDPMHAHVFGAARSSAKGGWPGKDRWQHRTNGEGREYEVADNRAPVGQGALCDCGAWLGALGLEPTPALYVAHLVDVFRALRRVLRADGTVWLNLGDSYISAPPGNDRPDHSGSTFTGTRGLQGSSRRAARVNVKRGYRGDRLANGRGDQPAVQRQKTQRNRGVRDGDPKNPDAGIMAYGPNRFAVPGLKPKDLVLMPARVALALQADGWYLRSDIVWAKPNPMPESVQDRPTKSHEYLFLLARSEVYYFDANAIAEPVAPSQVGRVRDDVIGGAAWVERGQHSGGGRYKSGNLERKLRPDSDEYAHKQGSVPWAGSRRNKRSVWEIATQPYPDAHFATFPEDLVKPCVLAGCPPGGTVLDPFAGAGTTLKVAKEFGCQAIGIELNPAYCDLVIGRLRQDVLPLTTAAPAATQYEVFRL